MFCAINKKTNEPVNSLTILDNPNYQFPNEESWIADLNEIENADEIKEKYNEVKVLYREGSTKISSLGKKFFSPPHFFIPNATKLGINIIPESKEHRIAKLWIYNRLKNKDLIFYYSEVKKPFKYINPINLKDLPIDISKIRIETVITSIRCRRCDIICPFIFKHPLLGNGIQIEIQFSKQRNKTKIERSYDAAFSGYSIVWIEPQDIEYITEDNIEIKKDALKLDSFAGLLSYCNGQHIKKLKYCVQEETRKLNKYLYDNLKDYDQALNQRKDYVDSKLKEFEIKINKLITEKENKYDSYLNEYSLKLPEVKEMLHKMDLFKVDMDVIREELKERIWTCPLCGCPMIKRRGKNGDFLGCSNFPTCRKTLPLK